MLQGTSECRPGEPAPISGLYQLLNVFGTVDGEEVFLEQGHSAPGAPNGFTWRVKRQPMSELTVAALQERAAELRAMGATARTADVRSALLRLAERFDKVAAVRLTVNEPGRRSQAA